jgi:L-methionine (R)-S-oxide reductase
MAEAARAELPADKAERYAALRAEIAAVIAGEPNVTARYATAASLLAHAFPDRFFWTGFYVVDADQAERTRRRPLPRHAWLLAHSHSARACAARPPLKRETILVPDVHAFPGHIACDSRSNSEIVTPVFDNDRRARRGARCGFHAVRRLRRTWTNPASKRFAAIC